MINFFISASTFVAIQTILALGLNLQYGLAGLLNLAYIFFVAMGAYVFSVVTLPHANPPDTSYVLGLHQPFLVGLVSAAVVVGILGFLIGAVALRNLRADYFAIVTLTIAAGAVQIISQFTPLFGGTEGIFNIPQPLGGVFQGQSYDVFFLAMCVVIGAVVFVIVELLRKSPFGLALRAVRDDQDAAAAMGRNVYRLKIKAFTAGCSVAGLGGALLASFVTAFSPAGWSLSETLLILVCVFVGGAANNYGAMLGTFLVIGLLGQVPTLIPLTSRNPDLVADSRYILIGLLIIVFLRWRSRGIIPERNVRQSDVEVTS